MSKYFLFNTKGLKKQKI